MDLQQDGLQKPGFALTWIYYSVDLHPELRDWIYSDWIDDSGSGLTAPNV